MQAANAPPTRSSPLFSVMVKPRGQDHCARCCGSVQTRNTRARGASNVRRMVSSRSAAGAAALFRALACMCFLQSLQFAEIGIEALEALLPVAAIALGPVRHLLQRSEEHTSELQSLAYLVCRLLLEKKNYSPPIALIQPP